jgi:hypothetical protein
MGREEGRDPRGEAVTATEEKLARLAATLDEYLAAVPRQREPNPPDLLAIFEKLDALEREMGPDVHPQLRHYLHQKSYRKAHLFLQDRDAENARGNCGR